MPRSLVESVCFLLSLTLRRARAARSSVYVISGPTTSVKKTWLSITICRRTYPLISVLAAVLCHSVLCRYRRRGCSSLVLLGPFPCATNNCRSCYWIPCPGRRAYNCFHQESRRCPASIVCSSLGFRILSTSNNKLGILPVTR